MSSGETNVPLICAVVDSSYLISVWKPLLSSGVKTSNKLTDWSEFVKLVSHIIYIDFHNSESI